MESTKQKLVASIERRLDEEISKQNPLKFLKTFKVEDYIDSIISITYLYTRLKKNNNKHKSIYVPEVISAIGHGVRNKLKQKRDSALAAKAGAFFLYSFEEMGVLKVVLGAANNGHAGYIIEVIKDDILGDLWKTLQENKTEKLPSSKPYTPWLTTRHETGGIMIKTNNKAILETVLPETHPIVYEVLNKAQEVGWLINKDVYDLQVWALKEETEAFSEIWDQANSEAKASKLREAKSIGVIAERFIDKTFYHLYSYDFRGRKYAATAYLHEQGSDLAKGLLLRADTKKIGEQGFFWLLISISNNWGGNCGRLDGAKSDKIPLNDRVNWVLDNEDLLLSYAEDPKVNQGWMNADKPWQFIAAVFEFKKLREWQESRELQCINYEPYDYESHIEAFIDGSTNGSQHLSALTKDEITAPYVNLVALAMPGDLYTYVGEHVWAAIDAEVEKFTPEEIVECNSVIDTLAEMKKLTVEVTEGSETRRERMKAVNDYRKTVQDVVNKASPLFWSRITDIKERRKIVKRNTMTLPYGGSAYGLGQQQIDDAKKHGISSLLGLEHKWGSYMGRLVYDNCKISLKRPMRLLQVFEDAGRKAENEDRFLSWQIPITNFPVVQHYVEGVVKKIHIAYGPKIGSSKATNYDDNDLQLMICFIEDCKPSKRKQAQGASPNAIHSLDAAHLMLTVADADFHVTTIHDSFGCLLGDMEELFILIRETFVKLYAADPLNHIMTQIEGDISRIEIGNLDVSSILESEYAFA